jgi:hypothetical protein
MKNDAPPTLLRDLRQFVDFDERDEQLRNELRALLLERARPLGVPKGRQRWPLRLRLGFAVALAGAAIAAAVAVLGLAGTAGTASAETVLRHAAAVRFAADEAVHLDYSVQVTLSARTSSGTGDVWVETDANGTPTLVAETLSLRKLPSAPPQLVERAIETPAGVYTYAAGHNAIEIPSHTVSSLPPQSPTVPLPAFLFNGATVAQRLQQLGAGAQGGARLLGQRTLDGFTVDAIQVDGWPNGDSLRTIFYFDAQSHLLRGFDVANTDASYDAASWQVRLASEQTTRADSVPSSTFKLNAPADAWVQTAGSAGDVLARLCPANLKPLLIQGQSLLTACRSTTPGLTEDALVAALSGSSKTDLDSAVAAGQITPDQAAQALASQQTQLRAFVTGSRPAADAGSTGTATTSGGK